MNLNVIVVIYVYTIHQKIKWQWQSLCTSNAWWWLWRCASLWWAWSGTYPLIIRCTSQSRITFKWLRRNQIKNNSENKLLHVISVRSRYSNSVVTLLGCSARFKVIYYQDQLKSSNHKSSVTNKWSPRGPQTSCIEYRVQLEVNYPVGCLVNFKLWEFSVKLQATE